MSKICQSQEGATKLLLKQLAPARLAPGGFTTAVMEAEQAGATAEQLKELLGKGRAKLGIFDGDLENGELEIGQVSNLVTKIESVAEIMQELTA